MSKTFTWQQFTSTQNVITRYKKKPNIIYHKPVFVSLPYNNITLKQNEYDLILIIFSHVYYSNIDYDKRINKSDILY